MRNCCGSLCWLCLCLCVCASKDDVWAHVGRLQQEVSITVDVAPKILALPTLSSNLENTFITVKHFSASKDSTK